MLCCKVNAQTNLVPNGSFEDTIGCPNLAGQVTLAKYWYEYASADYFNSCSSNPDFSTPTNWGGFQQPRTGSAYIALTSYADYYPDGREYVYAKLLDTLEEGKMYRVTFFSCCSKSHPISASRYTNNIGCRFTTFFPNVSQVVNYSHINNNLTLSDTVNWVKIEGTFIADSAYQYISIGNFYDDNHTQIGTYFNNNENIAYYFIDDISVVEGYVDTLENIEINIPNIFTPNLDGINDSWKIDLSVYNNVSCLVYNRWGNLIYQTKEKIINWNGETNLGTKCVDGVYFYIIKIDSKIYKGTVQLIR